MIVLPSLDYGVLAVYLAGLLALGLILSHRRATASDYFLASRKAGWAAVGLALVGSNISPGVLIGITGSSYAFGISVFNYDWSATVILVVFALFFLPAVLSAKVYTMPEFLERRYDHRVRTWFSLLTLALYILLDAAGALYCGTLVLKFVAPGLSFNAAVLLLAALSVLYSVTGGLRSVLYTQAVQAVVVLGSGLALAVFAFHAAGGWAAVMASAPPDHLHLIRPASDPIMPWTGMAFGLPVMAFYYWCTNQVMVQRMLAARSIDDGRKGALFAGFLKLSTLFLIALPGVAGALLFPKLGSADDAYLHMAFHLLPTGLLGLLVAAFLGALMAQLSASYNSAATLVTMDFIRRFRLSAPDTSVVQWGRISTVGCMVISALWAPQIVRFPSLWQYFQAVLAYATPPAAALFLAGMLWPRANGRGAIWAVAIGSGLGIGLFVLSITGVWQLPFLDAAFLVFLVSLAALVLASLTRPETEVERARTAAFTFANAWGQARREARGVIGWALALLVVTASVIWTFR